MNARLVWVTKYDMSFFKKKKRERERQRGKDKNSL